MAPSRRKVRPHRATKTKKSNTKRPKARKKAKGKAEQKIELEGITTYVYQKSFKPKPTES
ncbi:MAG: hypothetical protein OK452_10275 [Thaumarchaeota archaeon]|nr:hypothetical protein [Nitrososphaerota archaeon]